MATAPAAEPVIGEIVGTDIVATVSRDPGIVLLDNEKFDAFYARMKAETDKLVPDTSTAKGRDEIRSMAARVTRAKTAIDKARLALTKQWRDQVKMANDAGKVIEERLDALAEEVRKPLTEWEEAEKARTAECQAIIAELRTAAIITAEDTSATVRERGNKVWHTVLDPERFGDMMAEAAEAKEHAITALKAALARLTKEEADRAELERLRAEAAERERIEAERRAAEEAEQRRRAAEQAERERIERAKLEAAEAAAREAEEKAHREQEERERAHADALAAERRRAEEAERSAQAERERIEAEEAARVAEEKRLAAEQAAREADRAHRSKIMGEAKAAIMNCGAEEPVAKAIVLAIVNGNVPHVLLRF